MVLDSGWFILGDELRRFEDEFAAYVGAAEAVGVASGTDAVELALRGTDIGPGDAVLVPANTAVATIVAVERCGATPILCDVDVGYGLAPASAERALSHPITATTRPRALVAVHLYGLPADLEGLSGVCERHGLTLIEDCAQAHGATFGDARVGTFGAAAAFSFYPTKNLGGVGDGGAVVTRNSAVADRVRRLRQYGWRERNLSDEPGINSRLDELQAAVLRVLLRHLDAGNAHRAEIAEYYLQHLSPDIVMLPHVPPGRTHVWHQFVVQSADRDRFQSHLERNGVGTAVLYPTTLQQQPAYRDRVATDGALPVATSTAQRILSLPMGAHVDWNTAEHVVAAVNAWSGT